MHRPTLAIHGIWSRARSLNWIEQFEDEAQHVLDVRPREYGYVAATLSGFRWYRDRIVNSEVKYYERLLSDGPAPNAIAHSFGGYVAWALMALRGLKFHNVILLAPAAPADTNWQHFEDCFRRVRVYWSPRDEIISFAPYGKMGKTGPLERHPRVESFTTTLLHNQFVNRTWMKTYIAFLGEET